MWSSTSSPTNTLISWFLLQYQFYVGLDFTTTAPVHCRVFYNGTLTTTTPVHCRVFYNGTLTTTAPAHCRVFYNGTLTTTAPVYCRVFYNGTLTDVSDCIASLVTDCFMAASYVTDLSEAGIFALLSEIQLKDSAEYRYYNPKI